jgi:hypothetical protein
MNCICCKNSAGENANLKRKEIAETKDYLVVNGTKNCFFREKETV